MNKSYFLERVLLKRPHALLEYDYSLVPETFQAVDKVTVTCKKHGPFNTKVCTHMFGAGCRQCGIERNAAQQSLTTTGFIAKSKQKFGDRFDYSKTVYINKNTELKVTCRIHGEQLTLPDVHLAKKNGCTKCNKEIGMQLQKEKYLEKARKVHGDKYDYSRVAYTKINDKVEIVCPSHGSFWQDLYNHAARTNGCPSCAIGNDRLGLDRFIRKARQIHGDAYDYSKVVYETVNSMVNIVCKKHGEFVQRAGSHLAGNRCKKCFLDTCKLPTEDFIKNARAVHGDAYDYSKVRYEGNKTPVEIVCPSHGSFWQKPNTHTSSGNGCRLCSESKGERAVEIFLKKYGIKHIREYRILPYRYRFDFFLPEFNIYIEFHGQQHYMSVEVFGGDEGLRSNKERDAIKKQLVTASGGRLIVLSYQTLSDGIVEKELIRRLKRAYMHWYVIGDTIRVFKTTIDVVKTFGLPTDLPLREVDSFVVKTIHGARLLFEPF